MPNRILKDSICTSPNVDSLSVFAECFFYRLLVQCDDFGRMDARTAILRAKCYPLRIDTVSPVDVESWLSELVAAQLVTVYTVGDGRYLQMKTWERHQQIRAKHSKYPPMISDDINCNQLQSNVPVIQSNPIRIQSESDGEKPVMVGEVVDTQNPRYRHACDLIEGNGFGMLTPIVSDQVHELLDEYPDEWIDYAFRVAVNANIRRVDYVMGVLRKMKANGTNPAFTHAVNGNGSAAGFALSDVMGD